MEDRRDYNSYCIGCDQTSHYVIARGCVYAFSHCSAKCDNLLDHQIKALQLYRIAFGDKITTYKAIGCIFVNDVPTVISRDMLAGKCLS